MITFDLPVLIVTALSDSQPNLHMSGFPMYFSTPLITSSIAPSFLAVVSLSASKQVKSTNYLITIKIVMIPVVCPMMNLNTLAQATRLSTLFFKSESSFTVESVDTT